MHMRDDDKEWVKLNYSVVKDDEVLLDSLRDCHVKGIKFGLDFFILGLIGLLLILYIAVSQDIWYYYIFTIPCLSVIVMGACIFVSRAHYWINPRFEAPKYLDEITDYDACKIRWHAEKLISEDESIEDVLACTGFYIDG